MDPTPQERRKQDERIARDILRDLDRRAYRRMYGPLGPYLGWIAAAAGLGVFLWLQIGGVETDRIGGWTDRAVIAVLAAGGAMIGLSVALSRDIHASLLGYWRSGWFGKVHLAGMIPAAAAFLWFLPDHAGGQPLPYLLLGLSLIHI